VFFKRNYIQTVDLSSEVIIQASTVDIFDALSLRSVNNRFERSGLKLLPFVDDPYRFDLINPSSPGDIIVVTQTRCEPYHCYGVQFDYPKEQTLGVAIGSKFTYDITAMTNGFCDVSCQSRFYTPPMKEKSLDAEIPFLLAMVEADLHDLKTLVEAGGQQVIKIGPMSAFTGSDIAA